MSAVAVIIPTFNMGDTLERAVMSAAGADEIHVVDDASTDNTGEVMARLPVKVTYWRWPMKSRCHVAALRTVYQASRANQFIGMGADDVLLPGFVDSVRKHIDSAVIFSDYEVRSIDGNRLWSVSQEVSEETTLTPDQMVERLKSDRNATETGVGSSLRRDACDWLWSLNWDTMGTHSDCIGYAAVAALFGCVLLPFAGAAYYYGERSYSRNNVYLPEHFVKQGEICVRWMMKAGLDDATTRALAKKRCNVQWQ